MRLPGDAGGGAFWPGADGTIWVRRYAAAHRRTDLPPRDPGDERPPFLWYQYPTFEFS